MRTILQDVLLLCIKNICHYDPVLLQQTFYLKPMKNPRQDCWYYNKPVGHNPLSETVKRLCSKVGADGYYTNHSLRRTCATRLFQSGIDEQEIMAITGHRSTDGVRVYKEISHEQEHQLSKMIAPKTPKMAKLEDKDTESAAIGSSKKQNTQVFYGCSVVINN